MKYFGKFPSIAYDLSGNPLNTPIIVKNIFFRFKIIDAIKSNSLVYYPYYIKDNETPEIIAYKYYKDIQMHWLVMLANDIINPHYDWPLDYQSFIKYIEDKYIDIPTAQITIKSYQVTITRNNLSIGENTVTTYEIDSDTYNNTPQTTFQSFNLVDGTTLEVITATNIIFAFDYEVQLNETKKNINLISKDYLDQIRQEFDNLV